MIRFLQLILLLCLTAGLTRGQIYLGPANGSIPGGVMVSTEGFAPAEPGGAPLFKHAPNKHRVYPLKDPANLWPPTGPEGSNYHIDPSPQGESVTLPPLNLASFAGIPQTNFIPPDPHVAVGRDHIIQVVNSTFRIADKTGNTLRTINANSWFGTTVSGVSPFDPKVIYDHFADRWVMVWLDQNSSPQRSNYLVSVSDDQNPIGVWYNWALTANVNGSTNSGNWADYQGVGFDNQAFYFTSNQFTFAGNYNYVKLRIMAKSQFYANTAGPITWTDFWDLRDEIATQMFGIRPSIVYTAPDEYYLIGNSPYTTSTYMVLYRITNPLTSPTLTATNISVTTTSSAPNAGQPGGATPLEGGGSNLRAEPVYRDSSIWVTHAVRSGTGNQYSSVRYLRFSTVTNTPIEDVAFGADGFWHIYPNLAVDKDYNLAVTFTRTGTTEYASAGYSWRLNSDPPGLRSTEIFRPGLGSYVVVANGRNRWGDYLGIGLDPADQNNFWMLTEYCPSTNQWATWVQSIRLVAYPGVRAAFSTPSLNFGSIEANTPSDTAVVAVYNYGTNALDVTGITVSNPAVTLVGLPSFPVSLTTFDSIQFRVAFTPTQHGVIADTVIVASSDPAHSRIPVSGKGVLIGKALAGVMYAASGTPTPTLYTLNTATGAATPVGPLGIPDLQGLAIRPTNNELYAVRPVSGQTQFSRVSAQYGDALPAFTTGVTNLRAFAFSAGDTLYGATTSGKVYRIDIATGDTTFIGLAQSMVFSGLAFSPTSGKLWASVRPPLSNRDKIYLVNTSDGDTTLVGATGDGAATPSLTFDGFGRLYGLKGISSQQNSLIMIDTITAAGTVIGPTGMSGLQSIAMRTDSLVVSVGDDIAGTIPETFSLSKNYPNPFNPSTQIQFGLPEESRVKLSIFDVTGREIVRLVDDSRAAGFHAVTWNARNNTGSTLASGVYFYRLEATGLSSGKFYAQTEKMLLVK